MFEKHERSSFKYWFAHWCAFNMTALNLKAWKFKYLFHDIEKPWVKLFLRDYKKVQKLHRRIASHHLEYPGKKDYEAMVIDWECSRFTKSSSPETAYGYYFKKLEKLSSDDRMFLTDALYKLNLVDQDELRTLATTWK